MKLSDLSANPHWMEDQSNSVGIGLVEDIVRMETELMPLETLSKDQ